MIRCLRLDGPCDWLSELDLVGADPGCWERVAARSVVAVFKLGPLCSPAANILKQCLLSAGGDAIVSRGCIDATVDSSLAIVFGTPKQLRCASASLEGQPFGLSAVGREILTLLDPPVRPADMRLRTGTLSFREGPLIMGVINVTPDSFSDGGLHLDPEKAARRALEMHSQGADIVDIGAESTRPGSLPVPPGVQRERLVPAIRAIRRQVPALPVSVDTTDPSTAEAAIAEGADIINDVTALSDPGMSALAAASGSPVILMHMLGKPRSMQESPCYTDPVGEILAFLSERMARATDAGIPPGNLLVDPGIGFGKRHEDNISLLRRLGEFRCLGAPVVLGHSRKSFLGFITGVMDASERDSATVALSALMARDADILRVHDVAGTVQAVKVALAVRGG